MRSSPGTRSRPRTRPSPACPSRTSTRTSSPSSRRCGWATWSTSSSGRRLCCRTCARCRPPTSRTSRGSGRSSPPAWNCAWRIPRRSSALPIGGRWAPRGCAGSPTSSCCSPCAGSWASIACGWRSAAQRRPRRSCSASTGRSASPWWRATARRRRAGPSRWTSCPSRSRAPSASPIDAEGFLHTGDIGEWDGERMRIIDRKKDIIVTAGGKNVTPAYIENKLKFSPYIQDAVVVGDRRRFIVALILIDEENVTRFAQDERIPFATFADLTREPEVRKLIAREVDKVNRTLSSVESVKKFALLPRRLYEEDGDVTPTRKVKRRNLEARYADLIASLYGE